MDKVLENNLTKEFIEEMPYTDFVGLINQWNVLPGSYDTINRWSIFGRVNEKSRLLQVACTTGFQSREIASLTGCSGVALDLSEYAVKSAIYNKENYAPNIDIEYFQANGYDYSPTEKFTHIAVGAGLGFFPDPNKMFNKCIDFLQDGGYLLASPFYAKSDLPEEVIEQAKEVFGITPTHQTYKEIMGMYNQLEVLYEERKEIVQETEEEMAAYCKSTTIRACEILDIKDEEVYNAIFNRLYSIKSATNTLRLYQDYSVLVLRYRKEIYPSRYVELF